MGGIFRFCAALTIGFALATSRVSAAEPAAAPKSAPDDHAVRAKLLEAVGKTAAAAREYEAAFAQTRKPELLYRLAICWRTLGDYKQAREALRGYLREAPDGPLANEVERQLAQIAILIEARGLQAPPIPGNRPNAAKPRPERPRAIAAQPTPIPVPASVAPESAPGTAPGQPIAAPSSAAPSPSSAAPIAAGPPPAQLSAIALARIDAATRDFVSDQHEAPAGPASALASPAPAIAVQAAPLPAAQRARSSAPWIAGGAVLAAAGGAVLCVGAHEISSDLDAKFAAGTLTQADLPRYSKSRAEGIAGTALIGAAVLALGAAAVLAW